MCLSKRNITLIISCQFQTGLRILKTSFDFYVFFKSWLKKNLHCTCCVFRCLWQHNLKSIFNIFFFLGWTDFAWPRESPSRIQFSSASSSGKSKKGTKEILNGFLFHLVLFFQYFSYLLLFFDKHNSSDKCVFQRYFIYTVVIYFFFFFWRVVTCGFRVVAFLSCFHHFHTTGLLRCQMS